MDRHNSRRKDHRYDDDRRRSLEHRKRYASDSESDGRDRGRHRASRRDDRDRRHRRRSNSRDRHDRRDRRQEAYDFSYEEPRKERRRRRGSRSRSADSHRQRNRRDRSRSPRRRRSDRSPRDRSPNSDSAAFESKEEAEQIEKEKPCFKPSGILAEYSNKLNGVVLKFTEPIDAAPPTHESWGLYPFDGEQSLKSVSLRTAADSVSAFLLGRDTNVAHIVLNHESCSS